MNSAAALHRSGFADPIRLTLLLWAVVLTGAALTGLSPLQPQFLAIVLLAVGTHVGGMAMSRALGNARLRRALRRNAEPPLAGRAPRLTPAQWRKMRRTSGALVLVHLALLAYFLRAYLDVVPSLDTLGLLAARSAYLDEIRGLSPKKFTYTTHATLLGIAIVFFTLRLRARARLEGLPDPRWTTLAAVLSTFLMSLLTTGRTAPLLVIVALSFFWARLGIYHVRTVALGFLALSSSMFLLIALALGKEGLGSETGIGTAEALGNLARVYLFSAPAALQEVVLRNEIVSNVCTNIFAYPVDLVKKLGFFQHCEARELEFVFVPLPTNVFTSIRAYWEDFGWGFPLALFLSGMLVDLAYRASLTSDGFAAYLYPFVLNATLLQIFEEQIFANGSVLAYLCASYVALSWRYRASAMRAGGRRDGAGNRAAVPAPSL